MSGAAKDHFSGIAEGYARWRPTYPDALFEAIAAVVPAAASVWEPGCGSGQATEGLARHFGRIHASDSSRQQVAEHWALKAPREGLAVVVEPAEACSLEDASVDLVATAQALHWFDKPRFFAECERVLRPGGVLAAWTYQDVVLDGELGEHVRAFLDAIDPYWPPQRIDVDLAYDDIVWPDFEPLPSPRLWLQAEWNLEQLVGYFYTLSATAGFLEHNGRDAVQAFLPLFRETWGDPARPRPLRWPLILHLRRKPLAAVAGEAPPAEA